MGKNKKTNKEDLLCSFCGKSGREVAKLIAGPGVYACDECVKLMVDIIAEEYEDEGQKVSHEIIRCIEFPLNINRLVWRSLIIFQGL